jgi:hypothetical protein
MDNLLDGIKRKAKWNGKDAYPAWDEWKEEGNNLLGFAKQKGVLDVYDNRLKTDNERQRDETLNELRAAYFFERGCGVPIIEWHPNKGVGDFVVVVDERKIFCEVKSPGWEGEVVTLQGHKTQRLKQSKYPLNEVKGVDNAPFLIDAIKKAYKKFPTDMSTLLIIIDDFYLSCFMDALCIYRALYRERLLPPHVGDNPEGLFVGKDYDLLGGVLFINFELVCCRGFVWKIHLAQNDHAILATKLPDKLSTAINSIKGIDGSFVDNYKIDNGWLSK